MSDFFSGNLFDLAIYVCLFVAVVMGFMTGLLRSLATIFGYVCGMGVAVVAAPKLTSLLASYMKSAPPPTWIVVIATFVAAGAVIGALLRLVVGEMVGPDVSIPDRIAGALLVLKESQWRPVLSSAAQYGLQSLPPEVEDYIDRLKRQRRI